jgi:hypothetical protein
MNRRAMEIATHPLGIRNDWSYKEEMTKKKLNLKSRIRID